MDNEVLLVQGGIRKSEPPELFVKLPREVVLEMHGPDQVIPRCERRKQAPERIDGGNVKCSRS